MIANGSAPRSQQGISYTSALPELDHAFSQAFSDLMSDYYAGKSTRYLPAPRGVSALGSGADYHYRHESEYLRMIERARYFDRDNMVVGQGVNRLCANVVMDGLTLEPKTGDEQVNQRLSDLWNQWAGDPDQCDWEGQKTWHQMEQLALRNTIVDGDVFALLLDAGPIQWVEAHRCRNPHGANQQQMIHGVELDESRRRLAYHLTPEEINPVRSVGARNKFVRQMARDSQNNPLLLHLFQPKRFSQTRGVTAFAPSVMPTQYHDDLEFAMLVKAKVASMYVIFRQYQDGSIPGRQGGAGTGAGAQSTVTQSDGSTRTFEERAPGMEITGAAGEELKGFAPNIPNPEFFSHANLLLGIIALNLDLPMIVFMLDARQTNFSGWRGAMDQARLRFRQIQGAIAGQLHKPTYRHKVRQWIRRDSVLRRAARRLGAAIFDHVWHLPVHPYIEPLKDAQADHLQTSRNLTSQRRRAARRNMDWETLSSEIVQDRVLLIRKAKEAADDLAEIGVTVDWRELAYGPDKGISYSPLSLPNTRVGAGSPTNEEGQDAG